ncbi:SseB family protein [Buchananella hordeovulneris]|nr:SseB family protein [Buchananella hordeovulneris]
MRPHRRAGGGQRRHLQLGRYCGSSQPGAGGSRGRHHGQGAVRRRLHPARGPAGGGLVSLTPEQRARFAQRLSGRFAADDGTAPAALAAALELPAPDARRAEAVYVALRGARLLVPVTPHPHPGRLSDGGVAPHAPAAQADPCAQAALREVRTAAGKRALPVFSSVAALHAWDPTARPVPVEAERAALAALAHVDGVLLLDVAGPRPAVVSRPAVVALATGGQWQAPWRDEAVHAAVAQLCRPPLQDLQLAGGAEGQLQVRVVLDPAAPRAKHQAAVSRLGQQLADLRLACDAIELQPVLGVTAPPGQKTGSITP